jgi:hypothetical protein
MFEHELAAFINRHMEAEGQTRKDCREESKENQRGGETESSMHAMMDFRIGASINAGACPISTHKRIGSTS